LYARFDMVGSSTPLPAPHADFIPRARNATVTRAVIERKIFHPFDEAGRNGAERIDVSGLEHALDGLGRTKSGVLGRTLSWLDR
jgi:hypothetical protein